MRSTSQIKDKRCPGSPIQAQFHGQLRTDQKNAVDDILNHDTGVFAVDTAFGKTVVAIYVMTQRQVNTLILVHRKQLMEQWRERLVTFLNVPPKSIGMIGGGRKKVTGVIDIATIQTLNRKGIVDDLVANYGQVIVDECHHISAFSFEQVMRKVKAKYILGLTATPVRKDGRHPIIFMQCGPIRHHVSARSQAVKRCFKHEVIIRRTEFRLPAGFSGDEIHDVYWALVNDDFRNDQILSDVIDAVRDGRSPLLLTERKNHLERLAPRLSLYISNVFVLQGGMGNNELKSVIAKIVDLGSDQERLLIATGRFIGEGFDDARLDTLFLAHPISWKGTLKQYAGRLHRTAEGKQVVRIYDYVDDQVPVLERMFHRRVKGYRSMGYEITTPSDT